MHVLTSLKRERIDGENVGHKPAHSADWMDCVKETQQDKGE